LLFIKSHESGADAITCMLLKTRYLVPLFKLDCKFWTRRAAQQKDALSEREVCNEDPGYVQMQ